MTRWTEIESGNGGHGGASGRNGGNCGNSERGKGWNGGAVVVTGPLEAVEAELEAKGLEEMGAMEVDLAPEKWPD